MNSQKEKIIKTLIEEYTKKILGVVCEKVKKIINPAGPASGSSRVLRGGSWYSLPGYLRSAQRSYYSPGNRYSLIGFRLVRHKNP